MRLNLLPARVEAARAPSTANLRPDKEQQRVRKSRKAQVESHFARPLPAIGGDHYLLRLTHLYVDLKRRFEALQLPVPPALAS